jgi:hypothetical protein
MRFEVITAARRKMAGFWDVAPCSLVIINDRGSKYLRNVGKLLPVSVDAT